MPHQLRIAVIGQSAFGATVLEGLIADGHEIAGVFTIPDKDGKEDMLAQTAARNGIAVYKFKSWRAKGVALPEVLEQYQATRPNFNVMAFCSQFIPLEVLEYPEHKSINYHPSILPRHRGASAINWTLMQGDSEAGFTIFWPDDGLDTGPIFLIRKTPVLKNDTLSSVYRRFLFPEGVKALLVATKMVRDGKSVRIVQPTEGATYDAMMKKDLAKIDWDRSAQELHDLVRGCDVVPGAWTTIDGKELSLFESEVWEYRFTPKGDEVAIDGATKKAIVSKFGMMMFGNDDKPFMIKKIKFDGVMMPAAEYGKPRKPEEKLVLSDEEKALTEKHRKIWCSIVNAEKIADNGDFFKLGAASMDVVRLVEEIAFNIDVRLSSDDVYANSVFSKLNQKMIKSFRGIDDKPKFTYDAVKVDINKLHLEFPHQIFMNNEFVDSVTGEEFDAINPANEEVICRVAKASIHDVDLAVDYAEAAFESWRLINARDRGRLMTRLADLMEEYKEELATLETIDSGAVYTLALKTHIGMSIDTFRYYGGWCDKLTGDTIPINNARPKSNLTITKREPIGVCSIIIPWNYPLMMLAWKMGACLAAGNVVILKPAQVTSLTALKFAELTVKAGFPPGVINILPGSGRVIGEAMAEHPKIRKIGFTGSTGIGKTIMGSCAKSNCKKVSLELGGKSPLIVFADADLDAAVKQVCGAVFFNKGENCIAAGRIFVEEDIHDNFVDRIVAEVKKMKTGDPLDRATDHGPQNHEAHMKKLLEYIERGKAEGAKLVYGGERIGTKGLYLAPTVFTDVSDTNYMAKEESFGPIMIISSFRSAAGGIDEVIDRANDTEFGLASGVLTKDLNKALYVSERIEAGTVFVNTYNKTDVAAPFGGFKQSGFGKDLGKDALNEWTKTKCITIEYGIT